MKQILILAFSLFLIVGCTETPYSKLGDVEYRKSGTDCPMVNEYHWLMDMETRNDRDSVLFSTLKLGRKLELNQSIIDSSSKLYSILRKTCTNDSIDLKIYAVEFYSSLKGSLPTYLDSTDRISVRIWMRDKLTNKNYNSYKTAFEQKVIDKYLVRENWNHELDSLSGITFERLKKNNKKRNNFNEVKVLYSIQALNGQLISRSTKEQPFVFNKSDKGVLKGIRILVQKLAVGESLRAVVPSKFAFGPKGRQQVPGYMPVLMEFELLEKVN